MKMRSSGYTAERAAPHERAVWRVVVELEHRGYSVRELPVSGDDPDVMLSADYIDVKVEDRNLAVKVGSFERYIQIETEQGVIVWMLWLRVFNDPVAQWRIVTTADYQDGIIGGPRPPTARGSNTWWYLSRPRWSPFDEIFP